MTTTANAQTPWGSIICHFSDHGLMNCVFHGGTTDHAERGDRTANRWQPVLDQAVERFLDDGTITLPVDLSAHTPWTQAVYRAVLAIPPGRKCTYGEIAAAVDNPRAARAVGAALSRQPYCFFLPTHRVWPAHGGPGPCRSGAGHLRQELLRRENLLPQD